MTKVVVMSGACGFTTAISAEKTRDRSVAILVGSGCAMVEKMAAEITRLQWQDAVAGILDNPVYLAAGKHRMHPACPVPAAVLKALEVESDLNVKTDPTIVFERGE